MDESNDAIADVLEHLGTWQELQGAVPFKIIAYRNAAEALRSLFHFQGHRMKDPTTKSLSRPGKFR